MWWYKEGSCNKERDGWQGITPGMLQKCSQEQGCMETGTRSYNKNSDDDNDDDDDNTSENDYLQLTQRKQFINH